MRILLLAAGLAPLTTTLPGGVPCCELRYTLEPNPSTGAIDVTLTVHGYRGEALVLERPSPRPLVGLLTQDPEIEGRETAQASGGGQQSAVAHTSRSPSGPATGARKVV